MARRSRRRPGQPVLINPFAVREESGSAITPSLMVGTLLAGAAGLVVLGASPASAGERNGEDADPGLEHLDRAGDHPDVDPGLLLVDPQDAVGVLGGDPLSGQRSAAPPTPAAASTATDTGATVDAARATGVVPGGALPPQEVSTEDTVGPGAGDVVVSLAPSPEPAPSSEPVPGACPGGDTSNTSDTSGAVGSRGTEYGTSGDRDLACGSPGTAPQDPADPPGPGEPVAAPAGGSMSSEVPADPVLSQDGSERVEPGGVLATTGGAPGDPSSVPDGDLTPGQRQFVDNVRPEYRERILEQLRGLFPTESSWQTFRDLSPADQREFVRLRPDDQRDWAQRIASGRQWVLDALRRELAGGGDRAERAPLGPGVDLASWIDADRLRFAPGVDELDAREAVSRLGPVEYALLLRLPDDEQAAILGLPGLPEDIDRLQQLIRDAAAEHGLLGGRSNAPGPDTSASPSEELWPDIEWPGADDVFLRSETRFEEIPPDPRRAAVIDHLAGAGAEALAALRASEHRIRSDADWYRAVADVAGQLRLLSIGSSPVGPERARQLFPVLTEEELARQEAGLSPLMARGLRVRNERMAQAQRALVGGGPFGLTSPELSCWLVCDRDGRATVHDQIAVGTEGSVQPGSDEVLTPDVVTGARRVESIHTHPFAGWEVTGLSDADLRSARIALRRLRDRGSDAELGETSIDLLTGTATRWTADSTTRAFPLVQVLPGGAGPLTDVVHLPGWTLDTMSPMVESPMRVDVVPDGTSRDLFALVDRHFRASPEVLAMQRDDVRQLVEFEARLAASGATTTARTGGAPAPVESPSGAVQDLAEGLTSGRYTLGELVSSGIAEVNALDGPAEDLVIRTRKPIGGRLLDSMITSGYYESFDDWLQQNTQFDAEALQVLRDAGLDSPNPRLVRWRHPDTGSQQVGIVMDRLRGTRFHVPEQSDDEIWEPTADVVYSPPEPGPDLINQDTLERLRCARAVVVDCGLGWESMQGVLTRSGVYFLDPDMVLDRFSVEDPDGQRELHRDTLQKLDRLTADVQRRVDRVADGRRRVEAPAPGPGVVALADPAGTVASPAAPGTAQDPSGDEGGVGTETAGVPGPGAAGGVVIRPEVTPRPDLEPNAGQSVPPAEPVPKTEPGPPDRWEPPRLEGIDLESGPDPSSVTGRARERYEDLELPVTEFPLPQEDLPPGVPVVGDPQGPVAGPPSPAFDVAAWSARGSSSGSGEVVIRPPVVRPVSELEQRRQYQILGAGALGVGAAGLALLTPGLPDELPMAAAAAGLLPPMGGGSGPGSGSGDEQVGGARSGGVEPAVPVTARPGDEIAFRDGAEVDGPTTTYVKNGPVVTQSSGSGGTAASIVEPGGGVRLEFVPNPQVVGDPGGRLRLGLSEPPVLPAPADGLTMDRRTGFGMLSEALERADRDRDRGFLFDGAPVLPPRGAPVSPAPLSSAPASAEPDPAPSDSSSSDPSPRGSAPADLPSRVSAAGGGAGDGAGATTSDAPVAVDPAVRSGGDAGTWDKPAPEPAQSVVEQVQAQVDGFGRDVQETAGRALEAVQSGWQQLTSLTMAGMSESR